VKKARSLFPVLVLAAACLGGGGSLRAQTLQTLGPQSQSGAFDIYRFPARTAVLGPAYVGVADDANALFLNPAGLARLDRGQVLFDSYLGFLDSRNETVVAALPLPGLGGAALAGNFQDDGTFEGRDNLGSLAPNYGVTRFGVQGGWGAALSHFLQAGLSLNYQSENMAGSEFSYVFTQAGILFEPLTHWKIGLDYESSGWGLSNSNVSILDAGASWDLALDASTRLLAAAGYCNESNSYQYAQGGVEAGFLSNYFVRAGYRLPLQADGGGGLSGPCLGAGVKWAGFNLDYAYLPGGLLGDTHRISLGYSFDTGFQKGPQNENPGAHGIPGSVPGPTVQGSLLPGPAMAPSKMPSIPIPMGNGAGSLLNPPAIPFPGSGSTGLTGNNGSSGPVTVLLSNGGPAAAPSPVPTPDASKNSLTLKFSLPTDYVAQGEAQEIQGRYSQAADLYRKALSQDSRNAQAWWDLGKLYLRSGQREMGIQCLENVVKLRPEDQALRDWLRNNPTPNP